MEENGNNIPTTNSCVFRFFFLCSFNIQYSSFILKSHNFYLILDVYVLQFRSLITLLLQAFHLFQILIKRCFHKCIPFNLCINATVKSMFCVLFFSKFMYLLLVTCKCIVAISQCCLQSFHIFFYFFYFTKMAMDECTE